MKKPTVLPLIELWSCRARYFPTTERREGPSRCRYRGKDSTDVPETQPLATLVPTMVRLGISRLEHRRFSTRRKSLARSSPTRRRPRVRFFDDERISLCFSCDPHSRARVDGINVADGRDVSVKRVPNPGERRGAFRRTRTRNVGRSSCAAAESDFGHVQLVVFGSLKAFCVSDSAEFDHPVSGWHASSLPSDASNLGVLLLAEQLLRLDDAFFSLFSRRSRASSGRRQGLRFHNWIRTLDYGERPAERDQHAGRRSDSRLHIRLVPILAGAESVQS